MSINQILKAQVSLKKSVGSRWCLQRSIYLCGDLGLKDCLQGLIPLTVEFIASGSFSPCAILWKNLMENYLFLEWATAKDLMGQTFHVVFIPFKASW